MKLPPATAKVVASIFAAAAVAAVPIIQKHEGVRYKAYADPASARAVESRKPAAQRKPGWQNLSGSPWTVCYGHTKGVKEGDTATPEQCVRWAAEDARAHGVGISQCVYVAVPMDSAIAFLSFAFNVGVRAFCGSTVAKHLNAGNLEAACNGLSAWVYANKIKLPGLVDRRRDERALCLKGLR